MPFVIGGLVGTVFYRSIRRKFLRFDVGRAVTFRLERGGTTSSSIQMQGFVRRSLHGMRSSLCHHVPGGGALFQEHG
jgi:hypothetical protein